MNTTTRFHLTAAAFGVLIASSAYAETNQVYSYTVQAHNAPMIVEPERDVPGTIDNT